MRLAAIALAVAACAPRTQVRTVRYDSGQRRSEMTLVGSKPHGPARGWHRNGQLAYEGAYHDGAKRGTFTYWDESGNETRREQHEPRPAESAIALAPTTAPPAFLTLDTFDDHSRWSAQLGWHDYPQQDDWSYLTRLTLAGQVTRGRFGHYGQLSTTTMVGPDDREIAMGAADVGAYSVFRTGPLRVIPRLGAVLPVGGEDTALDAQVSLASAHERVTDLVLAFSGAWGLRAGASVLGEHGSLHYRADLGTDLALDDSGDQRLDGGYEVLGRANVGVALVTGRAASFAELASTGVLASDISWADQFVHTVALGARLRLGRVHPSVALVLPLDDATRGDVFILAVGAQFVDWPP
jgi:hypothetical protein